MTGSGSDGASVMTGRDEGVGVKWKKTNPHVKQNHCDCHRCTLCGTNASITKPERLRGRQVLLEAISHWWPCGVLLAVVKDSTCLLLKTINTAFTWQILPTENTPFMRLTSFVIASLGIVQSTLAHAHWHCTPLMQRLTPTDSDWIFEFVYNYATSNQGGTGEELFINFSSSKRSESCRFLGPCTFSS